MAFGTDSTPTPDRAIELVAVGQKDLHVHDTELFARTVVISPLSPYCSRGASAVLRSVLVMLRASSGNLLLFKSTPSVTKSLSLLFFTVNSDLPFDSNHNEGISIWRYRLHRA